MLYSAEDSPRSLRRVPLRGVDDPPGAGSADAALPPGRLLAGGGRSDPRLARLRGRCAHRRADRSRGAGRRRRAGHRPSLRSQVGAHRRRRLAQARRRRDRGDRALRPRRRRADRPRRDRAGQIRQQPQRAAGAIRRRGRERHRAGLRAPSRGAGLGDGRPHPGERRRPRPPGPGRGGLLLPRRDGLAGQRRTGDRPHPRDRRPPGRPTRRGHRARRRPGCGARRLGPLRR